MKNTNLSKKSRGGDLLENSSKYQTVKQIPINQFPETGHQKIVYDEVVFQLDLIASTPYVNIKLSAATSLLQTLLHQQQQYQHSPNIVKMNHSYQNEEISVVIANSVIVQKFIDILNPGCCPCHELLQTLLCILLVLLSNFLARNWSFQKRGEEEEEEEDDENDVDEGTRRIALDPSIVNVELIQKLFEMYFHLQKGIFSPSSSNTTSPVKTLTSPSTKANSRLRRKYANSSSPATRHSPIKCPIDIKSSERIDIESSSSIPSWRTVWQSFYRDVFSSLSTGTREAGAESLELLILFQDHILQLSFEQNLSFSSKSLTRSDETETSSSGHRNKKRTKLDSGEERDVSFKRMQDMIISKKHEILYLLLDTTVKKVSGLMIRFQKMKSPSGSIDSVDQSECQFITRLLEIFDLLCSDCSSLQELLVNYLTSKDESLLGAVFSLIQVLAPEVLQRLVDGQKEQLGMEHSTDRQADADVFRKFLFPRSSEDRADSFLDLFLQATKLSVSLTNSNGVAVDQIVNKEKSVDWAVTVLHLSFNLKLKLKLKLMECRDEGHRVNVRYVTEIIVLTITLLVNITEEVMSFHTVTEHYFFTEFLTWLRHFELVDVAQTFPSLESLLPVTSLSHWDSENIYIWIVKLILQETGFFIKDLLSFDLKTKPKIADPPFVSFPRQLEEMNQEEVPVCEILTSAHLILLLSALIFGKFTNVDLLALSRQPESKETVLKQDGTIKLLCDVVNLLPRKSFWLVTRVLKAHIALQGQCGVSQYASYVPSLMALAHFEKLDEMIGTYGLSETMQSQQSHLDEHLQALRLRRGVSVAESNSRGPHPSLETVEGKTYSDDEKNSNSLEWLFHDESVPLVKRSFSSKSVLASSRSSSQSTNYNLEIKYDTPTVVDRTSPAPLTSLPEVEKDSRGDAQAQRGLKRRFSAKGTSLALATSAWND